MRKKNIPVIVLLTMTVFSSCSAVADIFKAGAAVGIIAVIVGVALIIWLVSLFRGKS